MHRHKHSSNELDEVKAKALEAVLSAVAPVDDGEGPTEEKLAEERELAGIVRSALMDAGSPLRKVLDIALRLGEEKYQNDHERMAQASDELDVVMGPLSKEARVALCRSLHFLTYTAQTMTKILVLASALAIAKEVKKEVA